MSLSFVTDCVLLRGGFDDGVGAAMDADGGWWNT